MSNVESSIRPALILGDKTLHDITEDVCRPIEDKPNKYWWMAFRLSLAIFLE